MKDLIFISHAQPEDNYFCSWLASKIRLMGYNVWLELDNLDGGSSFNAKIENVIKEQTVLSLIVISNAYIEKCKIPYSGVNNEANLISQLSRGQEDFILPLQINDFPPLNFPMIFTGINTVNDFIQNWAWGLEKVIKFLEKKNIPKAAIPDDILENWYLSFKHKANKLDKEERYYSNWFPVQLPEKIYIHKPNVIEWKTVNKIPFPFIRKKDRIIGFFDSSVCNDYLNTFCTDIYDVSFFMNQHEVTISDSEETLKRPDKLFVDLVNESVKSFFLKRGLYGYSLSQRKTAYYYYKLSEDKNRVSLKRFGKTSRSLSGISDESKWYFAISTNFSSYPLPHIQIMHHVYFTRKTGELLTDDEIHRLRRSVPIDWYNRKWFEMILAMSVSLSDENDFWNINVSKDIYLKVNTLPLKFNSPIGYLEPTNVE